MEEELFSEDFLRKLEYLYVVARKVFQGRLKAQRRSRRRGASVEFADFRNYLPGDDPRYVDWKAYARLDGLFLKLFEEEEDLHIYLILDVSGSMDFGEPNKFSYALKLAAAIGYIGLAGLDRVSVIPFTTEVEPQLATIRGKGQVFNLLRFLSNLEAGKETDLTRAVTSFVHQRHRRGLAVLLSDFFAPGGYYDPLNFLRFSKFDVYAIQVIAPEEREPSFLGDMRLTDVESRRGRDVTVSEALLKRYKEKFDNHSSALERYCLRKEIGFTQAETSVPFDDLILQVLRDRRLFA